jgi:hypothetical protein
MLGLVPTLRPVGIYMPKCRKILHCQVAVSVENSRQGMGFRLAAELPYSCYEQPSLGLLRGSKGPQGHTPEAFCWPGDFPGYSLTR